MKPTTTSVFVSPVRPQTSQRRLFHGSAGRAAGAQWLSLPAAQEGQTKSCSGPVGGRFGYFHGCRLFLAALAALLLCGLIGNQVRAADKAVNRIHKAESNTTVTVNNSLSSPCTISDQDATPVMVVIRPGYFVMGSPETESGRESDEGPQHAVTIPKPFAISRCEITVGQFKQFIQDTQYQTTAETDGQGCYSWNPEKKDWLQQSGQYWNNPGFSQTDRHPVVCVSWQDAQRYLQWLAQRTGALYRLPTEAEWEYAARAGTATAYFWGDIEETTKFAWYSKNSANKTQPVGEKKPNAFGLYNMSGNVWEWTQDCWHDSYDQAPVDGAAWLETGGGKCDRRVVRGGSWNVDPQDLRSADRDRGGTVEADDYLGFRVARAL